MISRFDDSMFKRNRSKKVELLAKVYDHALSFCSEGRKGCGGHGQFRLEGAYADFAKTLRWKS